MSKSLNLSVILAARDKITGPLKKISASSGSMAKALKRGQDEIKQIKASQRDLGAFNSMDKALKGNAESLAETQNRMKRLRLELKTTKSPTQALRKEFGKAQKQAQELTLKTQEQRKSLGLMRKGLKEAGIDTRNLSGEEAHLSDRLADANKRIKAQQKYLANLGKADLGGSFRKMTGEIGRFSKQMVVGGAAVGGTLGLITHGYARNAEETDQWAKRLGMATSELSSFHYLGKQFGVDSGAMTDAIKEISLRTDEFAQTGKGPAAEAFKRLGLGQRELAEASGDTGKLMDMVLGRMSSIENVAARQRLADELFGGSGGEQLAEVASLTAKEIAAVRKEARELGVTFSEKGAKDARTYMKEWRRIQTGMEGVRNTIGSALLPVMTEAMGDMLVWLKENRKAVKGFAKELAVGLKNALPIVRNLASGIGTGTRALASMTNSLAGMVGGFDNLGMMLAAIIAMKPILAIAGMAKALVVAGTAVYGLVTALGTVGAAIKMIKVAMISTGIGALIVGLGTAGYLIYKNWTEIMDFFKGMPAWFSGIGSRIMDGLVGGITGGLKKMKDAVLDAGKQAIGAFKGVLGIKSPSRVFKAAGMDTLEGYRQGLKAKEPDALKDVGRFGKRVRNVGAGVAIGAASMPLAANIEYDNRPPISPSSQASAPAAQGDMIVNFNITGNNPQEIAQEVHRAMREMEAVRARRARSRLYDSD